MTAVRAQALEHLAPVERECLVRWVGLARDRLGARLLEVHVFGSFARGDAWRPGSPMHSDVDLLVLCTQRPDAGEIQDLVDATSPLFLECGRQLSPQFRTREALEAPATPVERRFLEQFRREGRLLFAAADAAGTSVPLVVGIHHVQLAMPAGCEAEARDFYTGVLGIPEAPKPAPLAARGGAWFERDDLRIHLGAEREFRPARKAHPALVVRDLPALVERCRRAGVTVVDDAPLPGFHRVYVSDPFGNRLELLEPRP